MGGTSSTSSNNELTLEEVARHNTKASCWIIRGKKVYDVTSYVGEHPGGEGALMGKAGGASDCTGDFEFHSAAGKKEWKQFEVGKLSSDAQDKFKIRIAEVKKKRKIVIAAQDAARPAYTPRWAKVNPNATNIVHGGTLTRRGSTIVGGPHHIQNPSNPSEDFNGSSNLTGSYRGDRGRGEGLGEEECGDGSFGSQQMSEDNNNSSLYSSPPTSVKNRSISERASPVLEKKSTTTRIRSGEPSSPLTGGSTASFPGPTNGSRISPTPAGAATVAAPSPTKEGFRVIEANSSTATQQREILLHAAAASSNNGEGGGEDSHENGESAVVAAAAAVAVSNGSPLTKKNLSVVDGQGKWVPCACGCDDGPTCINKVSKRPQKTPHSAASH